ncbi:lysophospholipid acyltransferase [Irineochytrium annulatum]|nr:lysophospholipid acyltransferase [Irineochytrium annulatum]
MVLQLLAIAAGCYTLVRTAPGRLLTPVIVSAAAILHLAGHLFWTQVWSPGKMDVSAPLMLMVIKLSTFSWAVYDGQRPAETLAPAQKLRSVKDVPGVVEFLGYTMYFGGFLVGPAFEFSAYRRFTRGEAPYDKLPSTGLPALKTIFLGILCTVIFLKFGDPWAHRLMLTPSFAVQPFLFRLWFLQVAGLVVRCKYYGAWKISEGVCILSGVGYTGKDAVTGADVWDRCENANIVKLETAQSPRAFIGSWNILTNQWLRNCVYNRIVEAGGKQSQANWATWVCSAFWHGFYPGYYITFVSGAMLTSTGISLRRNLRPLVTGRSRLRSLKPAYDVLGWALTQIAMNYICAPFPLHTLERGMACLGSVGYCVHWGMAVVLVAFGVKGLGVRALVRRVGKGLGAEYEKPVPVTMINGKAARGEGRKEK